MEEWFGFVAMNPHNECRGVVVRFRITPKCRIRVLLFAFKVCFLSVGASELGFPVDLQTIYLGSGDTNLSSEFIAKNDR